MSWRIDGRTFAKKVKNPSYGTCRDHHTPRGMHTECPSCGYAFEESEVWPGFPSGVKFDPSDQEILEHLAAQVGIGSAKPHPLISEFIPTIDFEGGICYTHPEKLPGIRRDGSSVHFFHIPSKAYMTGSRKRRKVQTNEGDELRWHKTGKTRPVIQNGKQMGCKKIMVLYISCGKQAKKLDKTNWVIHQYHLGVDEEEREGELVVSKVFYQTQPRQSSKADNGDDDDDDDSERTEFQLRERLRNDEEIGHTQVDLAEGCTDDLLRIPNTSLEVELTTGLDIAALRLPMKSDILRISHEWEVSEGVGSPKAASLGRAAEVVECHAQTVSTVDEEAKNKDNTIDGKSLLSSSQEVPDSQPLLSGSLDAELLKLLCNEELKVLGEGDAVNGLKNIITEATSSQDRSSLDKIFLGTPPELLESLVMNSQGASSEDWFEKLRVFGDSQRTDDFSLSEFFQNSQSQQ